jgi:hypothetical protein
VVPLGWESTVREKMMLNPAASDLKGSLRSGCSNVVLCFLL